MTGRGATETIVESPVSPDDLDGASAPRVRPDVAAIPVGPETVLVGEAGAQLLNPTGALVWGFLDGTVTLGELGEDFAAALEVSGDVVAEDLLTFARNLGANGLLEGVALSFDLGDIFEVDRPALDAVEVGERLRSCALTDLEGVEWSLDQLTTSRLLLVNWSPSCGFCVKIADALAAAEAGLAEHSVALVLVASGDAATNRDVLEPAGVRARVLLKQEGVDPFDGFGTPAAYLLDGDLRVLEPMAYGADEVPRLAAALAGLDDTAPDVDVAPSAPDARYLPTASAVCGPGGGAKLDSGTTKWTGTRAYRVGEFHIGLRYSTAEAGDTLDRLLVDAHVDDPRVPDNYSVALSTGSTRGPRRLNLLVQGGTQLVRSRSAARVLAALLQHLSADTIDWGRDDSTLLRVHGTPAVRTDGTAMVLPNGLVHWLKQIQPRLAARSITLVDAPHALIDARTRELVVPEPSLPYDPAVLLEVDAGLELGSELPYVRPGRYPLARWYFQQDEESLGKLSAGRGVAAAHPLVIDRDEPVRLAEQLVHLFETVQPCGVHLTRPGDLDAQLLER